MKKNKSSCTLVTSPMRSKSLSLFHAVFSLFIALILTSCEFWQKPVREYYEKWTQEVAIDRFEIANVESYYDKDGNLCIGSDNDVQIILYMRNPYHYELGDSGMTIGDPIKDSHGYQTVAPYIITEEGDNTLITQDPDDTTILRFTYDNDDLKDNDGGGEIGKTISIQHPYNGGYKDFTFSLKCNSKPPQITEAAIMNGNDKYVLAFYCPIPEDCKPGEIHNDIVSITINGTSYNVHPDSTGTLIFEDTGKFKRTRPELTEIRMGLDHDPTRAVYFLSNEPVQENVNKTYTIGYTDSAGLKSSVTLNASAARIAKPTIQDNDGNFLSAAVENTIHIDPSPDDTTASTITINVPTTEDNGDPLTGPGQTTIYWALYQVGDNGTRTKIEPAVDIEYAYSTSAATQPVPSEGHYVLKTKAKKDGYYDSTEVEYRLNLVYEKLKAPDVKFTDGSLLSSTSTTTNYIEIVNNVAQFKICLPDKDAAGNSISDTGRTLSYAIIQGKTPAVNPIYAEKFAEYTHNITDGYGYYSLTVYGSKPGYRNSDPVTYLIKAYNTDLYVKSGGNDTNNDGSSNSPFATVQRAVNEITAYNNSNKEYTIHIVGTVTGNQTTGTAVNDKASKITLLGESNGVLDGNNSGRVLDVSTTTPIEIKDLKITKGSNDTGAGIYADANSNITLQSGVQICSNISTNGAGAGLYIVSGATVVLNGGTIGGSSSSDANKALAGAGVHNGGSFIMTSGTISYNEISKASGRGGGILNSGICELNGGTISYNKAETNNSNGGGVYNTGTLSIADCTFTGNKAKVEGGAIYTSATFTVSGAADFDYSSSSHKTNDIYLEYDTTNQVARCINISGNLSKDYVAKVTPICYGGVQVLSGNVTEANCGKFALTDTFLELVRSSNSSAKTDIPTFYVSSDGANNATGKSNDSFKNISAFITGQMWNSNRDYVIKIIGEVEGEIHNISSSVSAKSITIQGTDSTACLNANSSSTDTNNTVLTINGNVPVTITNLTITGGQAMAGGGIYLNSNATLKLGDGVKITGNKTYIPGRDGQGGGVWVGIGAKLFIYGSCVIGDNGTHTEAAKNNAFANKAGYGGGIYNAGYVYIGYDSFDESTGTGNPRSCSSFGGIWYNYAKWGGGIYCANGVSGLPGGTVRMNTGYISYNGSTSNGGGITLAAGANKLSILGGTIANNETAGSGGAILAAKTFELSVRIPSGGAKQKNDIFLLIDDTLTPQIKILSNSLGGSGRILLTGTPEYFYKETTPYYTALIDSTGVCSYVSGAVYSFDVPGYNNKTWIVEATGKIKKQ